MVNIFSFIDELNFIISGRNTKEIIHLMINKKVMKQKEAVETALEKLGGVATLGQLNQETMKIQDCLWKTKTPFASIRRIV